MEIEQYVSIDIDITEIDWSDVSKREAKIIVKEVLDRYPELFNPDFNYKYAKEFSLKTIYEKKKIIKALFSELLPNEKEEILKSL